MVWNNILFSIKGSHRSAKLIVRILWKNIGFCSQYYIWLKSQKQVVIAQPIGIILYFLCNFYPNFENVMCYDSPLWDALISWTALISCPGYATNCFFCTLNFVYVRPPGPGSGHGVQVQLPVLCLRQTRAVILTGFAAHFHQHAWLISCNHSGCEFSKLHTTVTHIRTALNWVSIVSLLKR